MRLGKSLTDTIIVKKLTGTYKESSSSLHLKTLVDGAIHDSGKIGSGSQWQVSSYKSIKLTVLRFYSEAILLNESILNKVQISI